MTGRVCVVTGANSGIGLATARAFAAQGATVALVCRDRLRGEQAVDVIRRQTGNDALELFVADLASQAAIREVAMQIGARFPAANVLVHSAGASHFQRTLSVDGIELNLALNVLAAFLLTNELRPALQKGAPSRVVLLTGKFRPADTFDFDDPGLESRFSAMRAASQAGLAKILLTSAFARRLAGTGITVNCVYPGPVHTPLQHKLPWYFRLLAYPALPFFQSPTQGSKGPVLLAGAPDLAGISGHYFERARDLTPSLDPDTAERLWQLAERLTSAERGSPGASASAQVLPTSEPPTQLVRL